MRLRDPPSPCGSGRHPRAAVRGAPASEWPGPTGWLLGIRKSRTPRSLTTASRRPWKPGWESTRPTAVTCAGVEAGRIGLTREENAEGTGSQAVRTAALLRDGPRACPRGRADSPGRPSAAWRGALFAQGSRSAHFCSSLPTRDALATGRLRHGAGLGDPVQTGAEGRVPRLGGRDAPPPSGHHASRLEITRLGIPFRLVRTARAGELHGRRAW